MDREMRSPAVNAAASTDRTIPDVNQRAESLVADCLVDLKSNPDARTRTANSSSNAMTATASVGDE